MRYAKAIVAALGSVLTVVTAALADDVFSVDEIGTVVSSAITAALTVLAVFSVPNQTPTE